LDIGADDYVIKPFDAWELMARVKNLIELRKKLRDKYARQMTLAPSQIQVTTVDERFLKKCTTFIEQHLSESSYDTETLAHDMCMSRMQLNRKLQALTGHSTHELVREFRLQRAAEMLRHRADNVSGVAFEVGFNNLSHFARAFRERFGVLPSEYEGAQPTEFNNISSHSQVN
jgi:AraC-like DNA-binding protein